MGFRRALMLAMVAAWGLGTSAVPARADGAVVPREDYSPYAPSGFFVLDWSGFYVGGNLGGAHSSAESTLVLFADSPTFFQSDNFGQSETSVTGGVQAGWQRQWGKLVAGVEAGYTLLSFDSTSDAQFLPGLEAELVAGLTRSVEVRDIFLLTARLGYADGRWLAYAKGGLANAEVDVTYRDAVRATSSSTSGRENGWTAGVGIDYALTPNLFLGVEYNYIHVRPDIAAPPIPATDVGAVDIDIQNVVVRLNYRFGACCAGPGGRGGP
jgi:opacity protein-like surface antigen